MPRRRGWSHRCRYARACLGVEARVTSDSYSHAASVKQPRFHPSQASPSPWVSRDQPPPQLQTPSSQPPRSQPRRRRRSSPSASLDGGLSPSQSQSSVAGAGGGAASVSPSRQSVASSSRRGSEAGHRHRRGRRRGSGIGASAGRGHEQEGEEPGAEGQAGGGGIGILRLAVLRAHRCGPRCGAKRKREAALQQDHPQHPQHPQHHHAHHDDEEDAGAAPPKDQDHYFRIKLGPVLGADDGAWALWGWCDCGVVWCNFDDSR